MLVALGDPGIHPAVHFAVDPAYPSLPEANSFGEEASLLKPCNVGGAVENDLPYLPFR